MKKVESSNIKVNKEYEVKKEFDLKEAFALWQHVSKEGNSYLTGSVENMKLIGFYNKNKKNEKEPDIRVYSVENDEISKEAVASLWKNLSKDNKYYLTGTDNEGLKLVGFYNDNIIEYPNRPVVRVYYKESEK